MKTPQHSPTGLGQAVWVCGACLSSEVRHELRSTFPVPCPPPSPALAGGPQRIPCWGLRELWTEWVNDKMKGGLPNSTFQVRGVKTKTGFSSFIFFPENTMHVALAHAWSGRKWLYGELQCSQRTGLILWQDHQRQWFLLGSSLLLLFSH